MTIIAILAAALAVLILLPRPGKHRVKGRLSQLDSVGPGLVPIAQSQKRRARGADRRVSRKLWLGIAVGSGSLIILTVGILMMGPFLTLGSAAGAACLGGLSWVGVRGWTARQANYHLPKAILILANELRATNSFFKALEAVEKQAPRPAARQFGQIRREVARGLPEDEAFARFAARVPTVEAEILAKAIAHHPHKGQRLAASLYRIHEVLSHRAHALKQSKYVRNTVHAVAWVGFIPAALAACALLRPGVETHLMTMTALALFLIGSLALNRLCMSVGRGA